MDPDNLGSDLFGYKINYNIVEGLETPNTDFPDLKVKPRYNGNIAEVAWKTSTIPGDNLRRYGYVYDPLNRLKGGFYQKDTNPAAREYFEKMEYDLNGNIIHLKRSGDANQGTTANLIDELNYEYQGNRVTSIVDERNNYQGYPDASGNTIDYNDNGAMTSQRDKGVLQIDYNHLNLADYFQFDTSYVIRNPLTGQNEVRNVKLDYLYRADGLKLRKKYTYFFPKSSTERLMVTDYLDGFQYTTSYNGRTSLDFISTSEGYFDFRQNKYIYNYTDHLGNVRLSYFNNGSSTEVLEENNYYPFGLKHGGYNELGGNAAYQYKYNGKELQVTGMYDYGARFYMPDIGRWGVVDPLAETSRRWSTYTYAYNNPIRFIDPDGRTGQDWIRKDGIWTYDAKIITVEEAKKLANVNAFAKNGTVLADAKIGTDGEAGYVRLSEGGRATYEPMYGAINAFESAMPMELGGTWTTWSHEDFPSLTTTGPGRSDIDAGSWNKYINGDGVINMNFDKFLKPNGGGTGAMTTGFNKFRDVLGNLANSFGAQSDLIDLIKSNNNADTIYINDYTFKRNSIIPIDTTYNFSKKG